MDDVEARLLNTRVYQENGNPSLHKPLLLLYALGKLINSDQRLIAFQEIDVALDQLLKQFAPQASARSNTHYPFGKLENDGFWEIEQSDDLRRTSVGHLYRTELIDQRIHGGLSLDVFSILAADKPKARSIAVALARKYFPERMIHDVLEAVGLMLPTPDFGNEKHSHWLGDVVMDEAGEVSDAKGGGTVTVRENDFLAYLNSLHNLTASGANALAESQALSPYFGDIYEPFPLAARLKSLLADGTERVVILTGHAGDGKSTVALDVFKSLQGIPTSEPLNAPFKEREQHGSVTIVKDMSELSADARQQWIDQAIHQPGSWLIISNTGPLLDSLAKYAKGFGLEEVESKLLSLLNLPINESALEQHSLDGFGKPLLVLNLTRLDNVELGARILTRLVQHSGWQGCADCPVETACPLALNRRALAEAAPIVKERVRWIYRRINDYEQRLTLRQIVAQLAYGLTGGMGCAEARARVEASTAIGAERGTAALQETLFSEGFFGYRAGAHRPETDALQAIALLRRSLIGGPVGADFERRFVEDPGGGWARLPDALQHLGELWRRRAAAPEALPARAALRRMALIFGTPRADAVDQAEVFLDAMLRSPSLRELDTWQCAGEFKLSRGATKRLRSACLNVLLEAYSGFSAGQFADRHDRLYLTLRRPDRAVVQPTQLIIASLPFQDFDLLFDPVVRLPKLRYRNGSVALVLTLPLLDYIRRRDIGELGNGLSPIHQAQLDRFAAQLLDARDAVGHPGEIAFLRAGIDGGVAVYRYFLDEQEQTLERE